MKLVYTLTLIFFSYNSLCQTSTNYITIISNGSGDSKENAILNSLRTSLESTYGIFFTSKSEINNNNIFKDSIFSIVNYGNIIDYEIISEDELPKIGYSVTLKVNISLDYLTKYINQKGDNVEFNGGMFSMNMKLLKLNELAEFYSIRNLCDISNSILSNSIDFSLDFSKPKAIATDPANYILPITLTYKSNNNQEVFYNFFLKNLRSISMSKTEYLKYKNLNKYTQMICTNSDTFYLRNQNSALCLKKFIIQSNRYLFDFLVFSEVDSLMFNIADSIQSQYKSVNSNNKRVYNYNYTLKTPSDENFINDYWYLNDLSIPIFNAGQPFFYDHSIPPYNIWDYSSKTHLFSGLFLFLELNEESNGLESCINDIIAHTGSWTFPCRFWWLDNNNLYQGCNNSSSIIIGENINVIGKITYYHKISLPKLEKISKYTITSFHNKSIK
jgi:hypothetical protein